MSSNQLVQLIVLAAVAVFLILRLRGVLGTRDGFEAPPLPEEDAPEPRRRFDVVEGGADADDIADHVDPASPTAGALRAMRRVEPDFAVTPFISGAKQAYEMILMAFERGDLDPVRPFLSPAVAQAFEGVIEGRRARGETIEAEFLGTRETTLIAADFDPDSQQAEITLRFVGELKEATRDASGAVIEGDPRSPRKQRDTWTFARQMGANDPNWQLVATG